VRTVVDRQYPLEELAEAHRYVEQGHKRGNVIIVSGDV
jgi:NADPH:quinone reductase-like Zn-dependent oxidoreductase